MNGTEIVAEYRLSRGTLVTDVDDCALVRAESDRVVLLADGVRREFHVAVHGDAVFVDSSIGPVRLERVPVFVDPSEIVAAGSLLAPMPGSVVRISAAVGDTVTAGQLILWLEAMKMEHTITAPAAGVLTELTVTVGHQVDVDAVLAVVAAEGDQA